MLDKGMGGLGALRMKSKCPVAPVLEGERSHYGLCATPQVWDHSCQFQGYQRWMSRNVGCPGLLFPELSVQLFVAEAQWKSESELKTW